MHSLPHHLQEELAEARKSEQDAVEHLAEANSRCLNAEELLAKSHEAKEMLKHSLKEAVRVRDAQTTAAKDEARRNEELVSVKQAEIIGISQREQVRHTSIVSVGVS